MKRFLLASGIVLALAAGGGYAYQAAADTAGPNATPPDHSACAGPGGWGRGQDFSGGQGFDRNGFGPGGWGRHGHDKFSLFARVPDKHLSTADVKIIADAILLEHGNHDWTVTNVTAQADKSIDFSFATPHGDVIATFAVDPASGHVKRVS
jgi:hypothetical protein